LFSSLNVKRMNEFVKYQSEEKYAIITIDNGKANAISHEVIEGLNAGLDKAEQADKIVILTGTSGIFSGGFDLKVMTASPEAAKQLVTKGSKLSLRMLSFPKPILIACNGHAIAKGAFLLLSADYRIGVEGDFKIGLNEVMIGMTMHNAGIAIAKSRLSEVYVNRSVNNAEIFSSKDAVKAGFLDVIVPETDLLPTAIKVAELFSKLNKKAHAATKLKVRKLHLEALEKAIELDLEGAISLNS
jgi:enoyl-CoA hydratase